MQSTLRWLSDIFSNAGKASRPLRCRHRRLFIEQLEDRALLSVFAETPTAPLETEVAFVAAEVQAVQAQVAISPQSQPESAIMAGIGAFFSGLGTGLYNMGAGAVSVVQNVVTMPIDLVGTTADAAYTLATGQSLNYQPISYYGQASQAAIQSGTPWYNISGQTTLNAVSFGVYGLVTTGYYYYQTGDPTAFQQTTGGFAFTVAVGYGVQYYTNTANAPTYNLGGTGEVPGAINVQPPGAPLPPEPAIIAPSNSLPISPGSGNVIVNYSPIAPQPGLPTLGSPYIPTQISAIATGGYTITITQGSTLPGVTTIGQTAVINVVPAGSQISVTPVLPYSTTVVITTPTPITTIVVPYVPVIIQGPNGIMIQYVPAPQQQAP